MRRHHLGRRWQRTTPKTAGRNTTTRIRHSDRLGSDYMPDASYVARGLR